MDTAQILADLRAQRTRIDDAIAALEALNGTKPVGEPAAAREVKEAGQKVRRTLSPAGRRKIAAAQKARWAAKQQAGPVTDAKQSAPKKGAVKTAKRVISAESRKKMAEAQQKRWAKKRRATKAAAKKAAAAPVAATAAKEAPKL